MKDIILAETTRINPPDAAHPPPGTEPPRKRSKLFSFMGTRNVTATVPSVDSEMTDYFSQSCSPEDINVLSYWKQHASEFSTLSKLARQFNTIPALSAPVDRLFSVAGKIFRPDMCSLKDTTFETLMFLRMNTK